MIVTKWTTFEESFLEDYYSDKGVIYCARELNRTTASVTNKAKRMGLSVEKPFARRTKTHEEYMNDLKDKDIDIWPIESYINAITPIEHICERGHIFTASPNKVLTKQKKCLQCSAYRFTPFKPAVLYLVSFDFEDTRLYTLGLTRMEPKEVFKSDWIKHNMKLEWSIFYKLGSDAYNAQQDLLNFNSQHLVDTDILREGNTQTSSAYIEKPGVIKNES